jgi:hypothetical protein
MPLRAPVKPVRPAPLAGPQTALASLIGRSEKPDIFAFRPARGTGRQAINSCCQDTGQEFPIIGAIAFQKLPVKLIGINENMGRHIPMLRRFPPGVLRIRRFKLVLFDLQINRDFGMRIE